MSTANTMGYEQFDWLRLLDSILSWAGRLIAIAGFFAVYFNRDISRQMRWLVWGMGMLTMDLGWGRILRPFLIKLMMSNRDVLTVAVNLSVGLHFVSTIGWLLLVYGLIMVIQDIRSQLDQAKGRQPTPRAMPDPETGGH